MVLLLAALKERNDERLDYFLLRAYMLVTGKATSKIKIHVPAMSKIDQKKTNFDSENIDHHSHSNKKDSSTLHLPKAQPKIEEISSLINRGYTC